MFGRLVSEQAVVNGGDLRQRKISEREALVIGRKQNDVREHVANLADNLEQDCVLYVCHGPNRDPFRLSKSFRLIGLTDPSISLSRSIAPASSVSWRLSQGQMLKENDSSPVGSGAISPTWLW
jgi:hypothetical protein